MTYPSERSTSPSSLSDRSLSVSSIPTLFLGSFTGSNALIISIISFGAPNTLFMFWNRKFDINPLRTTSTDLILRGIESTFSASSSISSPSSSSPITGKKFNNSRIFFFLVSTSPFPDDVTGDKSFANSSKIISVLAGSKSKT